MSNATIQQFSLLSFYIAQVENIFYLWYVSHLNQQINESESFKKYYSTTMAL